MEYLLDTKYGTIPVHAYLEKKIEEAGMKNRYDAMQLLADRCGVSLVTFWRWLDPKKGATPKIKLLEKLES